MKLNTEKLNELMKEKANGNYNKFAKMLNMNPGQLYKILTNKVGAGTVAISRVEKYLNSIDLSIIDYIF